MTSNNATSEKRTDYATLSDIQRDRWRLLSQRKEQDHRELTGEA